MKRKRNLKYKKSIKKRTPFDGLKVNLLDPVKLNPETKELGQKLDRFYNKYFKQFYKQAPSQILEGAFYAARIECRSNPDWMSQSANSMRELLYPLFIDKSKYKNFLKIFRTYIVDKNLKAKIKSKIFLDTFENLEEIYRKLTDLAHHGTNIKGFKSKKDFLNFSENDFENLMTSFVLILNKAFDLQQIYIHTIINAVLNRKRRTKRLQEELNLILQINFDAKNYFFAKADERWLGWLWDNKFLNVIKQKAEDPTRYGYRTPELRYLVRMAERKPAKVAEIISSEGTATTRENFNPEVIDQFLRICSELPAGELKKVIPKIKKENWVRLMSPFNQWGFEYEKMFKTLSDTKDYEAILDLADVVLSVKTKDEFKKEKNRFPENPFYFSDFSNIKVFDYLMKIDDERYIKEAFSLLAKKLGEIIRITGEKGKDEVFEFYDKFLLLYDVNDIAELKLSQSKISIPERNNIENLVAVIVSLSRQLIEKNCSKKNFVKDIYKNDIEVLPDSRITWRLKLFILSLCPKVFKKELKEAIFRLFGVKQYYHKILTEEYRNALQKVFPVLDKNDRQEYVKKVIEYFTKRDQEKESEKEDWHLKYGSWILSAIYDYLTKNEKKLATEKGFTLKSYFKTRPDVVFKFGTVFPRGQISQEEFHNKPIDEIVKLLKTEWTPENLRKKDKENDFFKPINAEGVGEQLKKDIPTRFQEYINKAPLFFERKSLDPHYTYSFLSGVREYIRNNRERVANINWEGLINLFLKIKKSGEDEPFENKKRDRKTFDVWLAGWTAVHSAMADVVQELLKEQNSKVIIDFPKYRDDFFEIIKYLLAYPDPTSEGEKSKNLEDPFMMAINTVRGQAFQSFVLFVYQDGKELERKKIKIKNDVKKIYEGILEKENTRALMFMFGHYLPWFYFGDSDWIKKLLPKIFPKEKKDLFLASTEGYLVQSLYREMFFDKNFQNLYSEWIDLENTNYSNNQKHFKDIDESLADHLALAFVHFSEFDFEYPLFKKFWEKENVKRHKEFISFIGRHCLSRDSAKKWVEDNKINIDKVKKLWDWILKKKINPKILAGFGFWVNPNEEIIKDEILVQKMAETLDKSNGQIDWDYGLLKRLPIFAEKNGKETLKIISNYLSKSNLSQNPQVPFLYKDEIKEAIKIIYDNGDKKIKQRVANLINELIEKWSSVFWYLEEIIEDKSEN